MKQEAKNGGAINLTNINQINLNTKFNKYQTYY